MNVENDFFAVDFRTVVVVECVGSVEQIVWVVIFFFH